jgi:transposase
MNFVGRIFQSWGWTWKKPAHVQLRKFTVENMRNWYYWVILVNFIPWDKLKFLDESHFVSRALYRSLIVGPRGVKTYVVESADLSLSYSLTLLLDMSNVMNPLYCTLRTNSNTELDFLIFLLQALIAGRLVRGDLMVMDNASVHWGGQTWEIIVALLAQQGVGYAFLPKYSPELNPCELVFNYVKNYIRVNRTDDMPVYALMAQALAKLSFAQLQSFYKHCVYIIDRIEFPN